MPILTAIRPLWLADRAARIGPNKGDDILDRGDAAETLGRPVDPIVQRAVGRKQELIGIAQALDVFTAEPAALHADDIEPAQPGAIAHDLAIGNDIALDPRHAP